MNGCWAYTQHMLSIHSGQLISSVFLDMHLQDLLKGKDEKEKNSLIRFIHKKTGLNRSGLASTASERRKVQLDSAILISVATEGKCTVDALTHGEWKPSYDLVKKMFQSRISPDETIIRDLLD